MKNIRVLISFPQSTPPHLAPQSDPLFLVQAPISPSVPNYQTLPPKKKKPPKFCDDRCIVRGPPKRKSRHVIGISYRVHTYSVQTSKYMHTKNSTFPHVVSPPPPHSLLPISLPLPSPSLSWRACTEKKGCVAVLTYRFLSKKSERMATYIAKKFSDEEAFYLYLIRAHTHHTKLHSTVSFRLLKQNCPTLLLTQVVVW